MSAKCDNCGEVGNGFGASVGKIKHVYVCDSCWSLTVEELEIENAQETEPDHAHE